MRLAASHQREKWDYLLETKCFYNRSSRFPKLSHRIGCNAAA
jgi:hypothetical protein